MSKSTTGIESSGADAIIPTEPAKGEVKFENVGFYYEKERQILSDVNFTLESGKCIAVVGPSGSGKSTLVNLIPRLCAAGFTAAAGLVAGAVLVVAGFAVAGAAVVAGFAATGAAESVFTVFFSILAGFSALTGAGAALPLFLSASRRAFFFAPPCQH